MCANINDFIGNAFMVYPIYFDLSKKKSEGRKFNKNLCIKMPKAQEIKRAIENCKVEFSFEANKKHPKDQDKVLGRFILKLNSNLSRREILKQIGDFLVTNRLQKAASENKVQNTLGLVRKKKNKKK
ncbi:SEC65 [Ecytonucleospora hepatopenaei]|uniref:SEC65 n=1 Tax=Ecytonucleospora hepatopenaei TaxID=646526 RepID=A0A1W0E9J4_9MICR|nr:SEC65 [Ecytonucleospora hepatopenaei]